MDSLALRQVSQKLTIFGKIELEGTLMAVPLIILSTIGCEAPSLASYYLENCQPHVLRMLEEDVLCSQFHLLILVLNTIELLDPRLPAAVGAVLVGLQKALQLDSDERSTVILATLSLKILQLSHKMLAERHGSPAEREAVAEQAVITSQLLLTNLATRFIFGRHNCDRVSCARAVGDVRPAVGWLPLYEG
jgi:hypothetical protein